MQSRATIVHAALLDATIRAGGTRGNSLVDNASTVADTELVGSVADNRTVFSAGPGSAGGSAGRATGLTAVSAS